MGEASGIDLRHMAMVAVFLPAWAGLAYYFKLKIEGVCKEAADVYLNGIALHERRAAAVTQMREKHIEQLERDLYTARHDNRELLEIIVGPRRIAATPVPGRLRKGAAKAGDPDAETSDKGATASMAKAMDDRDKNALRDVEDELEKIREWDRAAFQDEE